MFLKWVKHGCIHKSTDYVIYQTTINCIAILSIFIPFLIIVDSSKHLFTKRIYQLSHFPNLMTKLNAFLRLLFIWEVFGIPLITLTEQAVPKNAFSRLLLLFQLPRSQTRDLSNLILLQRPHIKACNKIYIKTLAGPLVPHNLVPLTAF